MEWLQQLLEKITSIVPRFLMLAPYEAGVRFLFGKYVKVLAPGLHLYWPLIQRIVYMEIQTQITDLRTQSVRTSDDRDIVVSGAVQFRITDIEKAVCNVQSIDASLENLALGIILEFVNSKTLSECQNLENLKVELRKGLAEAASGWGVKIEKVYITDIGHTRNIRLLTNPLPTGGSDE